MITTGLALTMLLAANPEPTALTTVEVTARDLEPESPRAVARLSADDIETIRPTHPSELFARIPGTWVTRGSGQEHLAAIRSPLLTGAGACGALLYMEFGVPLRPPGFCNVNNLFEVNLAQAESISVLRGPGGIGHASGGLHGVIDVQPRRPGSAPGSSAAIEAGSDEYYRFAGRISGDGENGQFGVDASLVDAGSFRVDEGYEHGFVTAHHQASFNRFTLSTLLSAARLDQDTAGFITGFNAFRDPDRRDDNDNPEAFRRATAVRLISRAEWTGAQGTQNRATVFARRSRMTFLQHFLPGKPLERNGQVSAGVQFDQNRRIGEFELEWGLDAELFDGFLFETQDDPASGPPALVETRPVGVHYDFDVFGQRAGAYIAAARDLAPGWRLRAGLHGDVIRYDYSTALTPGNRTDQGEACGFGGCLFNRPADRDDVFVELAPELTLTRQFDRVGAWLRLARGYRAPQATELYRLQRGQDVADLESETLDAIEIGLRAAGWLDWELIGFAQRKENYIFRDGEGFNVSEGRTRHVGVEFAAEREWIDGVTTGLRGTWARHTWRFDRDLGGEVIARGKDIASAPRRLASADLTWRPNSHWTAQLAVESTGRYFLDERNTRRYGGHTLWHAFAGYRFDNGWSIDLKLRNLLGRRYAERADFAFGNFRYFPGPGRSVFATLRWQAGSDSR